MKSISRTVIPLLILGPVGHLFAQTLPAQVPKQQNAPDVEVVQEARALFRDGVQLLEEGRLSRARDRLRRSLELLPTAATAFNLVIAYRGTGEALAGRRLAEQLLAGDFGELEEARAIQVETVRRQLDAMLGVVTFENPMDDAVVLSVDGDEGVRVLPNDSLRLPLDAGAHIVVADSDGRQSFQSLVRLGAGTEQRFLLELPAVEESDDSLTIALVASGAAVAVGTALGIVLAVTLSGTADPSSDPLFPTAAVGGD